MYQQTSLLAYREVQKTLRGRQKAVYDLLKTGGDWSNTEIARELGWPINTVTPRVKELREMGLVCLSEKRECRVTGLTVNAWEIRKKPLPTQPSMFNL